MPWAEPAANPPLPECSAGSCTRRAAIWQLRASSRTAAQASQNVQAFCTAPDARGELLGCWFTDIGVLNQMIVLRGFDTLDALRVFDLIYVMTSNSRTTKSMSVYVREQLIDFQLAGYGSAAATLLFLLIALITLCYMALARRRMEGH